MSKLQTKRYDMSVKFEATNGGFEYIGQYISVDHTMGCMNLYSGLSRVYHNVSTVSEAETAMANFIEHY